MPNRYTLYEWAELLSQPNVVVYAVNFEYDGIIVEEGPFEILNWRFTTSS